MGALAGCRACKHHRMGFGMQMWCFELCNAAECNKAECNTAEFELCTDGDACFWSCAVSSQSVSQPPLPSDTNHLHFRERTGASLLADILRSMRVSRATCSTLWCACRPTLTTEGLYTPPSLHKATLLCILPAA